MCPQGEARAQLTPGAGQVPGQDWKSSAHPHTTGRLSHRRTSAGRGQESVQTRGGAAVKKTGTRQPCCSSPFLLPSRYVNLSVPV